jgi:hypothetical protein
MKEFSTLEFEQLKQHLEYREDKTPRNLDPFFDVKMFELEMSAVPSEIVTQAFPKSNPEKAQIIERSANDFSECVIEFFSQLENTNQQMQFRVAYEFLEAIESCIEYEQSKIWEYVPDGISFDQLYDFISCGFTYIILDESKRQCLVIHGGYCD